MPVSFRWLPGCEVGDATWTFVFVEVSTRKFTPRTLVVEEFLTFMKLRGFRYTDFAGEWRDPTSGEISSGSSRSLLVTGRRLTMSCQSVSVFRRVASIRLKVWSSTIIKSMGGKFSGA